VKVVFAQIVERENIPANKRQRVIGFLKQQRAGIELPKYDQLKIRE